MVLAPERERTLTPSLRSAGRIAPPAAKGWLLRSSLAFEVRLKCRPRELGPLDVPRGRIHHQRAYGDFRVVGGSVTDEPGVVAIELLVAQRAGFAGHADVPEVRLALLVVEAL